MKVKDKAGKIYGLWTVVERDEDYFYASGTRRSPCWSCICDPKRGGCGILKRVLGSNLASGKSTGCIKCKLKIPDNKIEYCLSAKRHLFKSYKNNANIRGHKFLLDFDLFITLCEKPCFYCSCEPSRTFKSRSTKQNKAYKCNGDFVYNGIDRINNLDGYTIENCRTCCWPCNNAKRDMAEEDFKKWIEKLHRNLFPTKESYVYLEPTCLI